MSEVQTLEQNLIAGLSGIADKAIKKTQEDAVNWFNAFQKTIEDRVKKSLDSRPVLHVAIGDFSVENTKKLSSKPSPQLPRMAVNAKLGLHTLLVGPAGCGKTTAANQLAESMGLPFASVCLTAGASETWLFGRQTPTGFVEGPFSKSYREGGVFLADEIDAADANLLLSINTALSHDKMFNPMSGETITRHKDFIFVGAANTNGKGSNHVYTGRSRLDAATLDRFIILTVDYDNQLERELCPDEAFANFLFETRSQLKKNAHEEFISTRAFKSAHLQMMAGVKYRDISDSMTANWGDAAKQIAKNVFDECLGGKKKSTKNVSPQVSTSLTNLGNLDYEEIKKVMKSMSISAADLKIPF